MPLMANGSTLVYDVCIPHASNKEQYKANPSSKDCEQPTNRAQTGDVLMFAGRAILRRSRPRTSLPDISILQHMSQQIRHNKETGQSGQIERIPFVYTSSTLSSIPEHVDIDSNHHCTRHCERDEVAQVSSSLSDSTTEETDDQGRPTSSTNQRRNRHSQGEKRDN